MATNILNLPVELIAQILEYLNNQDDIFKARLSHSGLERASVAPFGNRFFRKRGFMMTSRSLNVLVEIARHEDLKKYVQHVWFNPDLFTFVRPACCPKDEEDRDLDSAVELDTPAETRTVSMARVRSRLSKQFDAYCSIMRDHRELMHSTKLEEELTKAFESLPNLRTVGMRRSEDYSPYGWTEVENAVGEDPRVLGPIPSVPSSALSVPTQLFSAIVGALAATGTRLKRLYTDAIEIDNIPESVLPQQKLDAACSSIFYIELNVIKGWLIRHPAPEAHNYDALRDPTDFGNGLVRLFKATRNLKEVGLQVFRDKKQSYLVPPTYTNIDSWRQSYPYLVFHRLASEVSLAHLTRIKLEKIPTTSAILQSFLKPSARRLTSLKIRDIRLLAPENEPRPWQSIFAFLHESCPELEYILFHHLMYDYGGISFTQDPVQDMSEAVVPGDGPSMPYVGGDARFTDYDEITLKASGKENVRARLEKVQKKHWYQKPLFSYEMDEDVWHTDTSDEEW